MNEENTNSRINTQIKRSNGILTKEDLFEAYKYFEGKCPYSETPINDNTWHLEHIIPVIMGGTTDPWNCIPECGPCKLSKGGKHLLDWWDSEHTVEEEYKLEKIFTYIVEQLNKPRDYRITTSNDEYISKLQQKELSIEENDEDISLVDDNQKLDTFTFLYQMLKHLVSNKQYLKGDIQEYINILKKTYDNNLQHERLDTDLFELQSELVMYLKSIGVVNHYSIAFSYTNEIFNKISIEEMKNNMDNIKNYLQTYSISELINKNPNILLLTEEEFSARVEYVVNILNIPLDILLDKPAIINEIELLKELYNYCNIENVNFYDIPNWSFTAKKIKEIQKIVEVCKNNGIKAEGNVFLKNAEEIQKIVEICKNNGIKAEGTVFQKNAEEIQKIVELCKNN